MADGLHIRCLEGWMACDDKCCRRRHIYKNYLNCFSVKRKKKVKSPNKNTWNTYNEISLQIYKWSFYIKEVRGKQITMPM